MKGLGVVVAAPAEDAHIRQRTAIPIPRELNNFFHISIPPDESF
jgi:hypothetical protein